MGKKYVFDYYSNQSHSGQPVQSTGNVEYIYTNAPILMLEEDQAYPRTQPQCDAITAGNLALPNAQFGLALSIAYRGYLVHRLWDPNPPPSSPAQTRADLPPVANRVAAAVDGQGRADHVAQAIKQHNQIVATDNTSHLTQTLYLFNVIVALEWVPTPEYRERLEWAFRQMSDLLYDITDGRMAFGQVIVGDRSWLSAADIQIMASNRLLPRSWVSGLLVDEKHMPIRAGRGIWNKRARRATAWDEYEAFSSLVHEWAHYALNQRDEYLDTIDVVAVQSALGAASNVLKAGSGVGALKIVTPQYRARADTIMATPNGISELAYPMMIPHAGTYYPNLIPLSKQYAGPNRLPLPLPAFHYVGALDSASPEECLIQLPDDCLKTDASGQLTTELKDETYWVYVLHRPGTPEERMIAQGTFDATSGTDGFQLLGAAAGDTIIVSTVDDQGALTTWRGVCPSGSGAARSPVAWSAAVTLQTTLPAITIQPAGPPSSATNDSTRSATARPDVPMIVTVEASATRAIPSIKVFPLGERAVAGAVQATPFFASSLDGHILIEQSGQPPVINPYSQGGGPASAPNVTTNPITAGSADGEVLLFFDATATLNERARMQDYAQVRVITTTLSSQSFPLPKGTLLSNVFAIQSNAQLPPELSPTLIILMDPSSLGRDQDVFIYRLEPARPVELPTYVQPGGAFAATPLTAANAGGSLLQADEDGQTYAQPRVEYYCLCARP